MWRCILLLCIFFLASCTSPLETTSSTIPVVPVSEVLNSLKCGLSEALVADARGRAGLLGSTAKVELDANVIQGIDSSGKVSIGIPILMGGVAGSVTPSFGFTHSEVRTLNSSVDFDVFLTSSNPTICKSVERDRDSGFSNWLGAIVASVNSAVAGPPYASMKQYIYESDFTVKVGSSGGVDVEIVPVKLSTSAGASRSDIQHLKITINPVTLGKDGRPIGGGGKAFGGPRFRPVSTSEPSVARRGLFNRPIQ